jgi:protein TonB
VPATAAVADDALDDVPDAAGLRQFRLALATEARRFRRYPDAARREGLAGTAEVRIAVLPGAQYAELSRSSGHALLDAAALDMLQQATTRTQLPESLRGRRFVVFLPVVFAADD